MEKMKVKKFKGKEEFWEQRNRENRKNHVRQSRRNKSQHKYGF